VNKTTNKEIDYSAKILYHLSGFGITAKLYLAASIISFFFF